MTTPAERRRVTIATIVGTSVEWYDFVVCAAAAGLVFAKIFFAPLGGPIGPPDGIELFRAWQVPATRYR